MLTPREMLADLQASGVSRRQVAAAANCHIRTVDAVALGRTRDPSYSLGKLIECLHDQLALRHNTLTTESDNVPSTGLDADPAVGS